MNNRNSARNILVFIDDNENSNRCFVYVDRKSLRKISGFLILIFIF
jgi:hypothetical protein